MPTWNKHDLDRWRIPDGDVQEWFEKAKKQLNDTLLWAIALWIAAAVAILAIWAAGQGPK